MKNISVLTILTLCLSVSTLFAGSVPDIKEGKYEITTKMEMPGMPVAMPPQKHTQCITKKDLIPQKTEETKDCVITDQKTSGNTVSWKSECKTEAGTSNGTGKITYKNDTFQGEVTITMPQMNMKMTSTMSGRRIGPCK